jgi:hypothetical protein
MSDHVADRELLEQLRSRSENRAVLGAIENDSCHGDLAEVLEEHAQKAGGMRTLFVSGADFAAMFATVRGSDKIVIAASGTSNLMIRSGGRPESAKLTATPSPNLGSGWWRVNPWDAEVSEADVDRELDSWFALATVVGAPERRL